MVRRINESTYSPMPENVILSLSAIIALVPSSLLALRRDHRPDIVFWLVLMVAVAGPLILVLVTMAGSWRTDLSTALWVTIAATMAIFAVDRKSTRLNSSHKPISYAVFCLKKKNYQTE